MLRCSSQRHRTELTCRCGRVWCLVGTCQLGIIRTFLCTARLCRKLPNLLGIRLYSEEQRRSGKQQMNRCKPQRCRSSRSVRGRLCSSTGRCPLDIQLKSPNTLLQHRISQQLLGKQFPSSTVHRPGMRWSGLCSTQGHRTGRECRCGRQWSWASMYSAGM